MLKDISQETGYSVNTVSLALKKSHRISAEVRAAINKAAKHLHYVPNGLARSLVTKESKSIGVIVRSLKSPVLMDMMNCVEEYLRQKGFCAVIMGAGIDLAKSVDSLLLQNVGGMLIYPVLGKPDYDKFRYLRSIGFPFVLMSSDGSDYGMDTVYIDRRVGAYKAVTHLASLGHKRIGFIGAGDNVKLEGYLRALKDYGLKQEDSLAVEVRKRYCQGGYDACAELLDRNKSITALFCATDLYALGAVKCCRDRGITIPGNMSIAGFDNLEESAFFEVPLTTVTYNITAETEMAIELLFRRMREGAQEKNENIALEPELIIRESTISIKGYQESV